MQIYTNARTLLYTTASFLLHTHTHTYTHTHTIHFTKYLNTLIAHTRVYARTRICSTMVQKYLSTIIQAYARVSSHTNLLHDGAQIPEHTHTSVYTRISAHTQLLCRGAGISTRGIGLRCFTLPTTQQAHPRGHRGDLPSAAISLSTGDALVCHLIVFAVLKFS